MFAISFEQDMNLSLLNYLSECRRRLLYCVAVFSVIFFVLFPFSNTLYHSVARPLLACLPNEGRFIATAVTTPLWVPVKWVLALSLMLSIPFIISQFWLFIAPALYKRERSWFLILLLLSSLLFYLGMLFAYTVVFPLFFQLSVYSTPSQVTLLPEINHYLDFVLQWLFAFGMAFEVPIVIFGLVRSGLVDIQYFIQQRRILIVLFFILAMLLTPPDVMSQIFLAIPLCLLFELGILLAKYLPV